MASTPQTDDEIKIAQMKLECIKVASKHSFSYTDIVKQAKELFELLNLL